MEDIPDGSCQCFTCGCIFKGPVFCFSRGWERVSFDGIIPEIEVRLAEGLDCYCSRACREVRRKVAIQEMRITPNFPDLGPIERCARCAGVVYTEQFHLVYTEEAFRGIDGETYLGFGVLQTLEVVCLGRICQRCEAFPAQGAHEREEYEPTQQEIDIATG